MIKAKPGVVYMNKAYMIKAKPVICKTDFTFKSTAVYQVVTALVALNGKIPGEKIEQNKGFFPHNQT